MKISDLDILSNFNLIFFYIRRHLFTLSILFSLIVSQVQCQHLIFLISNNKSYRVTNLYNFNSIVSVTLAIGTSYHTLYFCIFSSHSQYLFIQQTTENNVFKKVKSPTVNPYINREKIWKKCAHLHFSAKPARRFATRFARVKLDTMILISSTIPLALRTSDNWTKLNW